MINIRTAKSRLGITAHFCTVYYAARQRDSTIPGPESCLLPSDDLKQTGCVAADTAGADRQQLGRFMTHQARIFT